MHAPEELERANPLLVPENKNHCLYNTTPIDLRGKTSLTLHVLTMKRFKLHFGHRNITLPLYRQYKNLR